MSNGFNFTRGKKKKKKKNQVQKSKVFTLRKKRARVLRRVEWLPFYEEKNTNKKKKIITKSKSPRFLRCVKKGPSFTPCRMASILRGRKKKKKNKSKSPRFLRCLKKKGIKARVLRRVEWLPFYAEGEKIVVIIKKKKISFFKNHQKIPTAFALVFSLLHQACFASSIHPSIHPSIHIIKKLMKLLLNAEPK